VYPLKLEQRLISQSLFSGGKLTVCMHIYIIYINYYIHRLNYLIVGTCPHKGAHELKTLIPRAQVVSMEYVKHMLVVGRNIRAVYLVDLLI
jgi:hypothetical protein